MNGYCKLNMNCSPLLPSCEKVIWVLSICIRAGLGHCQRPNTLAFLHLCVTRAIKRCSQKLGHDSLC